MIKILFYIGMWITLDILSSIWLNSMEEYMIYKYHINRYSVNEWYTPLCSILLSTGITLMYISVIGW